MRPLTRVRLARVPRAPRYAGAFVPRSEAGSSHDCWRRRLTVLACAALAWLLGTSPAYAYLDPGTGGMLLQLLLGGAFGALVVGKLYFSKFKAFCSSIFIRDGTAPEHEDGGEA